MTPTNIGTTLIPRRHSSREPGNETNLSSGGSGIRLRNYKLWLNSLQLSPRPHCYNSYLGVTCIQGHLDSSSPDPTQEKKWVGFFWEWHYMQKCTLAIPSRLQLDAGCTVYSGLLGFFFFSVIQNWIRIVKWMTVKIEWLLRRVMMLSLLIIPWSQSGVSWLQWLLQRWNSALEQVQKWSVQRMERYIVCKEKER